MRTTFLRAILLSTITASCALLSACHSNPAAQAQTPATSEAALTGSLIKRPVQRNGMITDGQSVVLILDTGNIQTSGANDIQQLLNQSGVRH